MDRANFGVIGLGVMGHMLALNMERNGFKVAGYDSGLGKVRAFSADSAGEPVDAAIASLKPHLAKGDLLIAAGTLFLSIPNAARRNSKQTGSSTSRNGNNL